ncbi:unnamed protein product [Discosporangium mesarthrocarpum]
MSEEEKRTKARAVFEEVNGFPAPEPPDFFQETSLDHVFGEVWTRPGLTRKERRWITLTTIAMTGAETAMEVHVRSALSSGDISREEMGEFAAHFAHYAGFPIATQLYTTFRRVAAELDEAGTPAS